MMLMMDGERRENVIRERLQKLRESQHGSASSPHLSAHPMGALQQQMQQCMRAHLSSHLSPHIGHMPCNTSPLSSSSLPAFMSFSLSVPFLLSLMECQGLAQPPAARLHGHIVSFPNCPLQTSSIDTHTHAQHREIDLLS